MERRVLLAITLSFLVLFVYQALVGPPPADQGSAPVPASQEVPTQTGASGMGASPGAAAVADAQASSAGEASAIQQQGTGASQETTAARVGDTEEREIVVETPIVRAVFTNRGGRLLHWVLKDFDRNGSGEPIDLVPEMVPPDASRPFELRVDDPAITARLNSSLYRVSGPDNGRLVFDLETAGGLRVRKVFVLDPRTYVVSFTASVEHGGQVLNPTVVWGPGMTDEIAHTPPGSFFSPTFVYQAQAIYDPADDDVVREAHGSLGSGIVREGAFQWAGVDDHYFISAVLHPPSPLRVEYRPLTVPAAEGSESETGIYVAYSVRFPSPPEGVRFYVGPKKLDVMRTIDPEFTRAIYFGMFAWLAAPLLDALTWVNGYVGSWGWSIIVLTILINLVMFPLRHKSVVSMRKMQELQPQMKAIQERYAKYKLTDPERQKMNQEVMELYRSKGVNPASGCVPMLITLPFLFAFYAMLSQAIEIRGESFGWIPDLALRDPLFITPALMGLSMFWQQKITPTTADPTQQKIMMIMPVVVTVTMLFAPAGLVIYWLVSNLWAIGQQHVTNALIGPPKAAATAAAPRPKDQRARRAAAGDAGNAAVAPSRGKK